MIDVTFQPIQYKNLSWYIDDIVMYVDTKKQMYSLIEEVLQVVQNSVLYIRMLNTIVIKVILLTDMT